MRASSGSKVAAIIGLVLVLTVIVSMLLTTFLPGGVTRPPATPLQTNFFQDPTPGPVTFPTPDPAGSGLTQAGLAVHPAGTFVIAQPQGFSPSSSASELIHSYSMVDVARYAVIHAYLQAFVGPQDLNTLDIFNSPGTLASTWSEYDNWTETGRDQAGDRLVIDFTLALGESNYLAREITWPVPENPSVVQVLRFVVPDNNLALLADLEALIIPSYKPLPAALSVPLEWPGLANPAGGYALRYAPDWALVEGPSGSTIALTLPGGTLTLSQEAAPITSEAEARAWAEASRADAEVLAVEPVTRGASAGYAVAYRFSTADGEPQSGLVLLMDGPDEGSVAATLRLDDGAANLLAEDGREAYADLWQVLDTFTPLPQGVIQPEPAN